MGKAMELLYERAVRLQTRLDNIHQPDPLFIEVLRTSVKDEDFSLFIDYNEASNSSREFYERCIHAIRKQEWEDAKNRSLYTAGPRAILSSQTQDISSMPLPADTGASSIALPRNVLFARTGRRYGTQNARRSYNPRRTGKNPMRNGQYLRCRQCGSEHHFIRDCPEANKNRLVYFAVADTGDSAYDLSFNDTLDLIQELPDDEWGSTFGLREGRQVWWSPR